MTVLGLHFSSKTINIVGHRTLCVAYRVYKPIKHILHQAALLKIVPKLLNFKHLAQGVLDKGIQTCDSKRFAGENPKCSPKGNW